jgi:hypothetical protein
LYSVHPFYIQSTNIRLPELSSQLPHLATGLSAWICNYWAGFFGWPIKAQACQPPPLTY